MASNCFNLWKVYENSKGQKKWVNEGRAPDGVCPNCPQSNFPAAGTWDGWSAYCQDGAIHKRVADGQGGKLPGPVLIAAGTPKAIDACIDDTYIGTGPISNYF